MGRRFLRPTGALPASLSLFSLFELRVACWWCQAISYPVERPTFFDHFTMLQGALVTCRVSANPLCAIWRKRTKKSRQLLLVGGFGLGASLEGISLQHLFEEGEID